MRARALVLAICCGLPGLAAAQAAPLERLLFGENFDARPGDGLPTGWLPLQGDWFLAERAGKVLRQGNQDLTRDAWILSLWEDYSVALRFQAEEGEGPWGIGVLGYLNDEGGAYRLRAGEGGLHLERVRGRDVRGLARSEAAIERGRWYSLRLSLRTQAGATDLLGKVWPSDAEEPQEWAVRGRDERGPEPGGTIALWTGNCAGRFAEVSVRSHDQESDKLGNLLYGSDFGDAEQGRLPLFWKSAGGVWVRDTQDKSGVLRQMLRQSGPSYDDNALATLDWTGYTVSADALAHPGPGKWGLGLVAYVGARGASYRLRALDNKLFLVKQAAGGRVLSLASAPVALKRGRWYGLKLTVDNLERGARLLGKMWDTETPEPEGWMVGAFDGDQPLRGGASGLWSFGCAADFDNFQVKTSVLSALNASLAPSP